MAKIAIGMFESAAAAEAAVRELTGQGFRPEEVELVTGHADPETGPPVGGPLEDMGTESSGPGVGTGVAGATYHANLIRVLSNMGVPQHSAEEYAEGVRRGSALVLVKTDDDRADVAADVLNRRDALRVEERVAQWTAQGWKRQFARTGEERGLSPRPVQGGVQVGRDRSDAGGARVFVW